MVRRRTLVSRAQFRKLPNGAIYYDESGTSGPFVKTGRRTILPNVTIADTSISVVRVSRFVLNSQDAIGG